MEVQASFDTWTTLFLVVSAIGTFLSILLFTDKTGRQKNWPIALITLGFALILVSYVFYWTGYQAEFPFMSFYPPPFYLAFGPLLYHYIVSFYVQNAKINMWHFLPFGLLFLLGGYYAFSIAAGYLDTATASEQILYRLSASWRSPWITTMSFGAYIWLTLDFIRRNSTEAFRSESQELRKKWTRFLTRLFSVFTLAYASYFILVNFEFFNATWDYAISVVMAVGIYGIGYMAYTEPQIFNGELFVSLFSTKNGKRSGLKENTKEEFYLQLVDFIEKEKPYRDNDLRLVHLADKFGFSSHLLSQLINEKAHKNFNRFINEFRLTEAERMLANNPSESIKNVYFDVGFNSKATFYNAFRKKHGCTPSEFINREVNA